MGMEDTEHLLARFRKKLLSVTRVRDRFTLLSVAAELLEAHIVQKQERNLT